MHTFLSLYVISVLILIGAIPISFTSIFKTKVSQNN